MFELIVRIFFGWPAVLVTLILAAIGLFKNNFRFLVAAALLATPFSWLLSGFPVIRSPAFLLPLLLFTSGYFVYRGREMLAWLVAVPYFLTIWLLFTVVSQQPR